MSVSIRDGMFHYPDNPGVTLRRACSFAGGDEVNITELDFGAHTATHVDAPVHFLEDGDGAEKLPLEKMIGTADVVDGTSIQQGPIDATALAGLEIPDDCTRLVLKTRNSELWALDHFTRDFVRLDEGGARYIVDRGIELIALDYLSIGDPDAHRALLSNGVVPLEGLDLREVEPGRYTLLCLPLKLVGSDGAPARVVLLPDGWPTA
ncbi:MAG: cyclase family protein [Actinomycetota bacterium]|nr:cyclase family protein [Actinomycetota bacterium]